MNVHVNQKQDQAWETACVYFRDLAGWVQRKTKPKTWNQKFKNAGVLVASSAESQVNSS